MKYFSKMKGVAKSPPRVGMTEILWSWIGSFLGIGLVALIHDHYVSDTGMTMIIGSFGASAVLLYGAVRSPLAQPRNVLGGHMLSALVGVGCYQALPNETWLAASLAVSISIAVMHMTKTLHPPGGATALIAVIGGPKIHELGFLYVLMPVASGVLAMLAVAVLVNNIPKTRRYPEFWF